MKIVFVSNYYNHHQSGLSDCLNKLTEGNYAFIETKPMSDERRTLGYGMKEIPSFVLVLNEANRKHIFKLIEDSDVVICGSVTSELERFCLKHSKVFFRYSERPLKKGFEPLKLIPRMITWRYKNGIFKKTYLLSASAYATFDYNRFGLFKNRSFKWGYFPITRYYDIKETIKQKEKHTLLWCGRFIDWKHPEIAIQIADKLKKDGYEFSLNIIGTGPLKSNLEEMIKQFNLHDVVTILGAMKPDEVRTYMEKTEIFIFTSDFQEGWGAVLNEAMNSGCAVVASHAIGSAPYLIRHKENGLIYKNENVDNLYEQVKYLLNNPSECMRMGENAYQSIVNEWNYNEAAKRLVDIASKVMDNQCYNLYDDGPCSKAEVIKNNWFKEL